MRRRISLGSEGQGQMGPQYESRSDLGKEISSCHEELCTQTLKRKLCAKYRLSIADEYVCQPQREIENGGSAEDEAFFTELRDRLDRGDFRSLWFAAGKGDIRRTNKVEMDAKLYLAFDAAEGLPPADPTQGIEFLNQEALSNRKEWPGKKQISPTCTSKHHNAIVIMEGTQSERTLEKLLQLQRDAVAIKLQALQYQGMSLQDKRVTIRKLALFLGIACPNAKRAALEVKLYMNLEKYREAMPDVADMYDSGSLYVLEEPMLPETVRTLQTILDEKDEQAEELVRENALLKAEVRRLRQAALSTSISNSQTASDASWFVQGTQYKTPFGSDPGSGSWLPAGSRPSSSGGQSLAESFDFAAAPYAQQLAPQRPMMGMRPPPTYLGGFQSSQPGSLGVAERQAGVYGWGDSTGVYEASGPREAGWAQSSAPQLLPAYASNRGVPPPASWQAPAPGNFGLPYVFPQQPLLHMPTQQAGRAPFQDANPGVTSGQAVLHQNVSTVEDDLRKKRRVRGSFTGGRTTEQSFKPPEKPLQDQSRGPERSRAAAAAIAAAAAATAMKRDKVKKAPAVGSMVPSKKFTGLVQKWNIAALDPKKSVASHGEAHAPAAKDQTSQRSASTSGSKAKVQPIEADRLNGAGGWQEKNEAAAHGARADQGNVTGWRQNLSELAVGLPPGWQPYVDPTSGDVYYGNIITKETTWQRPAA